MDNLSLLNDVVSRSICAENPNGAKGGGAREDIPLEAMGHHAARDLGKGWKIKPCILLKKGSTIELANIKASGAIKHIWVTNSRPQTRGLIIRFYWDDSEIPAVECPLGDFFFNGWDRYRHISSAYVSVNPGKGYNCFWDMPFKKSARITLENRSFDDNYVYYQIDYQEYKIPDNAAYFHARFRRTNPLPYKQDYTVLDKIEGNGKYVGTYLSYGSNNNGWWGEGEIKFFLDGDDEYPTICGTGTEDYFLGAYNFENQDYHQYENYNTLYAGFYRLETDTLYKVQNRFGMYRIHARDAIYFKKDIRITLQCIGWRSGGRFNPQCDDLASVSYWYMDTPNGTKQTLPSADECEVI